MLEIRLLGQFDLRREGEPVEIPSRPAQSLLAYLILNPGIEHRREKLAGMLWPDSGEVNARNNLRHSLWRLRKALGGKSLHADKIAVAFQPEGDCWLDVVALESDLTEASTTENYMSTLAVYGGELLPGFYEDWIILERERLRVVFEQRIKILLDRLVAERRWEDVLEWAERWIALGHVPEPAYRALMRAYGAAGDAAGVAATYQRCRHALEQDLGVEPSELTQATYEWLAKGGQPPELETQAATSAPSPSPSPAISALVSSWREQGVETLDVASLAMVHAAPEDLKFADSEAMLLIRSALQNGLDVEPWLRRTDSPENAVAALVEALDSYPKPRVRMRIVEALKAFDLKAAAEALFRVAAGDDAASVRSEAALAVARQGRLGEITSVLADQLRRTGDAAAMAAFVAIADEVGLPDDVDPFPRLSVAVELLQRRWRSQRTLILRQTARGGIGAGLALAIHGSATPFYMAMARPDDFREALQFITVPAWMISGAVVLLIIGGLQGIASGFAVGLADALWRGASRNTWRNIFGSFSGLVHSAYLIVFSITGLLSPLAGPQVHIPVNIVYGLILGLALAYVVPTLGEPSSFRRQFFRSLRAAVAFSLVTIVYVFVIYLEEAGVSLFSRVLFGMMLPMGFGLALTERFSRSPLSSDGRVQDGSYKSMST